MNAYIDPYNKVVFEWQTGDDVSRTLHSVALDIPPENIAIRFNKNVQQTLTTQGYVFNHALDQLPNISCKGTAYRLPTQDDGKVALSGIEYLHAAYVASGRNSNDSDLKKSISGSLTAKNLTALNNNNFIKIPSTLSGVAATIFGRSAVFTNVATLAGIFGVVQSNGQLNFPTQVTPVIPNNVINNIKNSTISYAETLTDAAASSVKSLVSGLTAVNLNQVVTGLSTLSTTYAEVSSIVQRINYIKDSYLNTKLYNNYPAYLDPTLLRTLVRDPDILIKNKAAQQVYSRYNQITNSQNTVRNLINQANKKDWVILITMYWQNMIFRGHFTSFNLVQTKDVINLWNWDFNFVAQESYLLKQNTTIPWDRAFDPNITTNTPVVTQINQFGGVVTTP